MSFLARFMATFWRACSALLAIGAAGLCASVTGRDAVASVVEEWAVAALMALGVGLTGAAVVGTLRLLVGMAPGSVNDPSRKLARLIAPHRRAIVTALAVAAAVSPVLFSSTSERARTASLLLVLLALRARHLTWFGGVRHASDGRVRFAAARQLGNGHVAFVGGLVLLLAFIFTTMFRAWVVAPIALFVLGWFAWALPRRYVTVGRDGVLVARWRERFYPFDGETTVDARVDGMVVVPTGSKRGLSLRFDATSPAQSMFLAERIRALMSPDTGASPPELEASLASLDEAGGYRVAELPRETLWRIVEAQQMSAPVRVRAAELIAQDAAEDDLPHLQRVADDLAEPATSAALARLARVTG